MYTTCSELAIFMYWTCNSINNLFSYCGLFIWCKIKCFWKRFSCKKIFDKMYFLIQTPSNMKLKCWYITPLKYVSVFQFHQCLVLRTFRQQDWFFFLSSPKFFPWNRMLLQICPSQHIRVAFQRTPAIESFQDFLIKLDMKSHMHLVKISIFSLYNVTVRLTKIMNRANKNWVHFLNTKYFKNQCF